MYPFISFEEDFLTEEELLSFAGASGGKLVEQTATGNPLTFTTNVTKPLKSLLIPWTPTQSGTGDPSPSNVRPIVGVDGVNVVHGGINAFDGEMELGTYNGNTGNKSDSSTRIRTKGAIPVKGGETYRFVTSRQSTFGISWLFYDKDDVFISNNNRADFGVGFDIPIPGNAFFMRFSTWDNYGTVYGNDIGVNYPSSETAYVPYVPCTTYSVQFPALGKNLLNPNASDWMTEGSPYRYINGVVPEGSTARFTLTDKDTTVDISGCYLGFVYDDLSESSTATGYKWVIDNGYTKSDMSNLSDSGTQLNKRCSNVFIYPQTDEAFQKLFGRYNIMVELGSTATAYEPYTSTVYGGSLDVTTGVLTIDRKAVSLDGNAGWAVSGTSKFYVHLDDPLFYIARAYDSVQQYSNMWQWQKTQSGGSSDVTVNKRFYLQRSDPSFGSEEWNRVWVYDTDYTLTTFKALLNETPLQVTYSIVPYTVQLTPTQITALLNDNTIWSDTNGSNTAVYMKKG